MIKIQLNSDIITYMYGSRYSEDHFYTYPDVYENDIADKLYYKEEFNRHIIPRESGNIKDKCDSEYFELAPHQLFLKNLISPNTNYYGLLIFHGVGVVNLVVVFQSLKILEISMAKKKIK